MATLDEFKASLMEFETSYNDNPKLKVMNRDWNRRVLVQASDLGARFGLILQDGSVQFVEQPPTDPDLVVAADGETLTAMFYGEVSPSEPYMDGTLKVTGSEEDLIRLDFVTAMIWG
ncbi:MAG: SCP2 sterol-binding domain-containing protein [Symbiobacteriia bacterium]